MIQRAPRTAQLDSRALRTVYVAAAFRRAQLVLLLNYPLNFRVPHPLRFWQRVGIGQN
jgi:hypothetical protein